MSSLGFGLQGLGQGIRAGKQIRQRDRALDLQEKRQTSADTTRQQQTTRQQGLDAEKSRLAQKNEGRKDIQFNQGQQDREAKLYDQSIERLHQGVRLIDAGGDAAQVSAQIGQGLPKEFQPNITVIDVQQGVDKNGQPVSENVYSIEFGGKPIGGGRGFTSDAIFRGTLDPTVAYEQFSAGAKIDADIPEQAAAAASGELGVRAGQAAESTEALGLRAESGAVGQEQDIAGNKRDFGVLQTEDAIADFPTAVAERGAVRTRAAAGETRAQEKHVVDIAAARANLAGKPTPGDQSKIRKRIKASEDEKNWARATQDYEQLYAGMGDNELEAELRAFENKQRKAIRGLARMQGDADQIREDTKHWWDSGEPLDEIDYRATEQDATDRLEYFDAHVSSIREAIGSKGAGAGGRRAPGRLDVTIDRAAPAAPAPAAAPAQQGVGGIRPQSPAAALEIEVSPGKTAAQVTDSMIQSAASKFAGKPEARGRNAQQTERQLRLWREKMGDEAWMDRFGSLTK